MIRLISVTSLLRCCFRTNKQNTLQNPYNKKKEELIPSWVEVDIVQIVFMALKAAFIVATGLYPQIKTDLCEMKAKGYFLRVERRGSSVIGHPSLM